MRESVINLIIAEVAKGGKETDKSMRLYVENRISYKTYKSCVKIGLERFKGNTVL